MLERSHLSWALLKWGHAVCNRQARARLLVGRCVCREASLEIREGSFSQACFFVKHGDSRHRARAPDIGKKTKGTLLCWTLRWIGLSLLIVIRLLVTIVRNLKRQEWRNRVHFELKSITKRELELRAREGRVSWSPVLRDIDGGIVVRNGLSSNSTDQLICLHLGSIRPQLVA